MNKDEQDTYDKLTSAQQIAVDLRLTGKPYRDIASSQFVNLQEHTICTWFMKGGVCHEAYEMKKKIRAEERDQYYRDEFENDIKELGREAIVAMREAIGKGSVQAIVKALELAGISQMSYKIQIQQDDEGVMLLREIVSDRRKAAKEEAMQDQKSHECNIPEIF